jgi:hypothetical protein
MSRPPEPYEPPPGLLTLAESCKRLGITLKHLSLLLDTGQIPYHQIGMRTLIDEEVVVAIAVRHPDARIARAAEQRRRELRDQAAMMTTSELRPVDKQVRHRTGMDDHLELGVPKIPRKYKDPARKAPDAIPAGPEPKVPEDLGPVPCANESCGRLFRKPQWAVREPGRKERFCSKECAARQHEREYRRNSERAREKRLRRVAAYKGEEYRPPSPVRPQIPATDHA